MSWLVLVAAAVGAGLWMGVIARRNGASAVLAAYAFFVPWGDLIPLPLPGELSSVSTVLGLVVIVVCGIDIALRRRSAPTLSASTGAFLVFAGIVILSMVWTDAVRSSARGAVVLAGPMLVYFVVAGRRWDPVGIRRFELGAVLGGATISILALGRSPLGLLATGQSGIPRFETVGGDANATAASLVLPLVIAAAWATDSARSTAERWLGSAATAALLSGVFLTVSRGGLLASMVALAIVAAVNGRFRDWSRIALLVAAVVVVGLLLAPSAARDHLTSGDSTGRAQIWELGLDACADHCLVGSGYGTFPLVYQEEFVTNPDASGFQNRAFKAHNVFLQMGVELGIAGLMAFALGLGLTIVEAARLPRLARAGPLAASVGLVITNSLITNADFKYFWLVPAYVVMVSSGLSTSRDRSRNRRRSSGVGGRRDLERVR